MMNKTLFCLLPLILLSGCQFPIKPQSQNNAASTAPPKQVEKSAKAEAEAPVKATRQQFCFIASKRHLNLLERELHYIQ